MSTRLDWEKAKRRDKQRRRPKGKNKRKTDEQRQAAFLEFVAKHDLRCFNCKRGGEIRWAKSGFSARGPWAICIDCVCKHKR